MSGDERAFAAAQAASDIDHIERRFPYVIRMRDGLLMNTCQRQRNIDVTPTFRADYPRLPFLRNTRCRSAMKFP
jgi:hypothetical protein